jgi:predicted nuclease of predicted toxin-antitoxin system
VRRFLTNEYIDLLSVNLLRAHGHDVISVKEQAPGADDSAILAWAVTTDRIVITKDRDYGDLIFRDRLPPPLGVIFIRSRQEDLEDVGRLVLLLLDQPELVLDGMFTVLTVGGQVRQRPLPR